MTLIMEQATLEKVLSLIGERSCARPTEMRQRSCLRLATTSKDFMCLQDRRQKLDILGEGLMASTQQKVATA